METKTYIILQPTPRLGEQNHKINLTDSQAKYWLSSGVIALDKPAPAPKSKSAKKD